MDSPTSVRTYVSSVLIYSHSPQDLLTPHRLYLYNLPSRPKSTTHFTRLLLRSINPRNYFVTHPSASLPQNTTQTHTPDLQPLDEKHGILAVSKSRSSKLQGQCFLTFKTTGDAAAFLDKFNKDLKVAGREVKMGYAAGDSLLAVSMSEDRPTLLQKILGSRHQSKLLRIDDEYRMQHVLRRRSRRLRSKLRKHGVDDAEIVERVAKLQQTLLEAAKEEHTESTDTTVAAPTAESTDGKQVKTHRVSNPPSNRLLVQGLPAEISEAELETLFQADGLKSVRLVAVRNVAFIEYDSVDHATGVLERLGEEYALNGNDIYITFAK